MEAQSSINLSGSGYAILRQDQQYLLLKYGPHGGMHGHPDKLNLILFSHGQRLSPDLGTPGYGLDLFESWYRQTLSHNTVTIDGLSQPPAIGQINDCQSQGLFQVADATVVWEDGPYAGVTMRRVILARPTYFLDVFLVEADHPKRIDWIYRNVGSHAISLSPTRLGDTSQQGDGYQHIANAQQSRTDGDWDSIWQSVAVNLKLFVAGAPDSEIIMGTVPGNPPTDRHGMVINRRHSTASAYISVFHPYRQTHQVTSVTWVERDLLKAGWASCVIQLGDVRERWLIRQTDDPVVVSWPDEEDTEMLFEYYLV